MAKYSNNSLRELMTVLKALSDENRVRMLAALKSGELCMCQIIELLRLAPSTVSKHMAILWQAGLVERRKDGRWIYYRLSGGAGSDMANKIRGLMIKLMEKDGKIVEDAKRLGKITNIDREALCRKQAQS